MKKILIMNSLKSNSKNNMEEFYGTIKLTSGEEIFAEILPVEENGRSMLVLSDPVSIEAVHISTGEGLRMIPWVKTNPSDSIVVVPMQHVITVVEASEDSDVVGSYMKFTRSKLNSSSSKIPKTGGFKTTVDQARKQLEKLYNIESKEAE
tara:strand:+ start:3817 stop:4266 length:450 start_codon:yes stop_codon:yes gene_type:complete